MGYTIKPTVAVIDIKIPRKDLERDLNSWGMEIEWGTFSNNKTLDYLKFDTETHPVLVVTEDISEDLVNIVGLQWDRRKGFYSRCGRLVLRTLANWAMINMGNMWVTGEECFDLIVGGENLAINNSYQSFRTLEGVVECVYKNLNSDLVLSIGEVKFLVDRLRSRTGADCRIRRGVTAEHESVDIIEISDATDTIQVFLDTRLKVGYTVRGMLGTSFKYKNTYSICVSILEELTELCCMKHRSLMCEVIPTVVVSGKPIVIDEQFVGGL